MIIENAEKAFEIFKVLIFLNTESIIKLLLDHGAAPEARNKRKYTPIMMVSDVRIARLLTQATEAEQEKANLGFLPVEVCIAFSHREPFGILLCQGLGHIGGY